MGISSFTLDKVIFRSAFFWVLRSLLFLLNYVFMVKFMSTFTMIGAPITIYSKQFKVICTHFVSTHMKYYEILTSRRVTSHLSDLSRSLMQPAYGIHVLLTAWY